jgi:uncharacterized protein DUF6916
MSTSRRNFLKKGTVLALATGVPLSFAKNAVAENLVTSPTETLLSKKDFAACLHSEFLIQNGARAVKTKLVQVRDLPGRSKSTDKEGFSLMFQSERTHTLKQNTYVIQHERLGRFSFLLVPAKSADADRNYYVATVNRLFP